MRTLHESGSDRPAWRAVMSVAATLCVLGFAGLLWMHDFGGAATTRAALVSDAPAVANDFLRAPTATGVPSAESVFKGAGYVPPEEPIAQF
ncbi:MAG TPA: hypothetical protein VJV77_04675 [Casimicrobiaceae bacterium]|nr:hypothetical protein [Casimicrobiaceae bacterium]